MDIDIKVCGTCGIERSYDSYHRMHSPCNKCTKRRFSDYYQNHRDKFLENQSLYYQNNKDRTTDSKKQKFNLQKNEICDLKNQINILTQKLSCVI